jgi:peptidyl-prolyl cis-trans isomerase D
MLNAIRERAQGWIAWAIVILISIPFALWGIQEYIGVGAEPVVASVNDKEITERELNQQFQQFRQELRERLGAAYRPELFDENTLKREVLDDMIRNDLIFQASLDMGLRAGDEQVRSAILSEPAFQKGGRFDKETYERMIGYQGLSSAQFEQQVRGSLMKNQLSQVVGASEILTDSELQEAVKLRRQQRRFSYFVLPLEQFQDQEPVGAAEKEAYYQAHQADFRSAEQLRVEYLVLDQTSVTTNVEPDAEALEELYQSRLDTYRTPEQRRARHILVTLDAGAGQEQEEAARQKIQSIHQRISDGEDFATLAKELSEDPGTAAQGGDLGMFGRGIMDPAFEKAAFDLAQGEVSEPVRSAFGFHLIEVSEIQPETVKPFAAVRDELVAAFGADATEHQYFELAEQLGNIAYENPDSLIPAAEALELKVQTSDWFGRSGGEGVFSNPKVVAAAFNDDVLRQGNNSEIIEIDDKEGQRAVVLRVVEHQEAALKPLEEVEGQIIQAIRDQRAREAAAKAADELVQRLNGGEPIQQVVAGFAWVEPGLVGRNTPDVPAGVLEKAFTLPAPISEQTVFASASLRDGSSAVVALAEVQEGDVDALTDQQKNTERGSLMRVLSRAYYDSLVTDLRERADVEITLKESE